jgi:hypothetical protein
MVSEQTREDDERLREELRHVDLEKLKKVIKPLISSSKPGISQRKKPKKNGPC